MARSDQRTAGTKLFIDQNVRGLKSEEKQEELFKNMRTSGAFAATLQETWLPGNETLEGDGFTVVCSGLSAKEQCNRGKQGVAVVLSASAAQAWRESGETVVRVSGRVIGLRIVARDAKGRDVGLVLISAYAPISTASDDDWTGFFDDLDVAFRIRQRDDILVIGMDGNSSLGTCEKGERDVCGPYGVPFVNDAGRRMHIFLALRELVTATTFFKKPHYTTWIHPRSKCHYQLDHIILEKKNFCRILNAGVGNNLVDSDHCAIHFRLRIQLCLRRTVDKRPILAHLDISSLAHGTKASDFCNMVHETLQSGNSTSDKIDYSHLQKTMLSAASEVLPRRERSQPGWFSAAASVLGPMIQCRNAAFSAVISATRATRSLFSRLKTARHKLCVAVAKAKNDWIISLCENLNSGAESLGGTKIYWSTIDRLRAGLSKTKRSRQTQMQKPDGTRCSTPQDNADVFSRHFAKLYARQPEFDDHVIDEIDQRSTRFELGDLPDDEEILKATRRLNNSAPGASELRAEFWKAIADDERTFAYLRDVIHHFWISEVQPEEWNVGRLGILPKKGDLSLPGNYRGIMMLEVAQKIASNIARFRLDGICNDLEHESQCGFRPERGTSDATFSLKLALKKRREHGLESWVVFIDFVKAFDRVPRELLWKVLAKFGAPPKLVRVIAALHNIQVHFSVCGAEASINSTIGVKQGDVLGPVLFVLYMAALTISFRKRHDRFPCIFKTKNDFVLTGRSPKAKGTDLEFDESAYADDAAFIFPDRKTALTDTSRLVKHCAAWGMEVHTGDRIAGSNSKTEAMFVAKPGILYEDPGTYDGIDLSDFELGNSKFIPVVKEFQYLGSMLTRDCRDDRDVDVRLKKASAAFGQLRKCVFSVKRISARAKRAVYVGLILAVLLHGSESWSLTEVVYHRLRLFHAHCARVMSRITLKHAREHCISTKTLLNQLGLQEIDTYVSRRQLRWAGHVARMPWDRLPRKMISSWCNSHRPNGAPQMTYGRSLYKALKKYEIDQKVWSVLAADRAAWRSLTAQ